MPSDAQVVEGLLMAAIALLLLYVVNALLDNKEE